MSKPNWFQRTGGAMKDFFNRVGEYIDVHSRMLLLGGILALGEDSGDFIAGVSKFSIEAKLMQLQGKSNRREASGFTNTVDAAAQQLAGWVGVKVLQGVRAVTGGRESPLQSITEEQAKFGGLVKLFFKALGEKLGVVAEQIQEERDISSMRPR